MNTYKPYRTHIVFAYIMLGFSVISLVIAGMLLRDSQNMEVLLFLVVGCFTMVLTYYFFASSKVMIVYGAEGLRIINDRRKNYYFVPWEKIPYGYCERNYKGHMFLVLSASKLNKEQIKKLANKGANSSKVCLEDAIVIPLDGLQDTSKIKGFVEKSIVLMDETFGK